MASSADGFAVDRLGLILVHPKTAETTDFKPTSNIIFVHGLRGHPIKTWSYTEKTAAQPSPEPSTSVIENLPIASKRHIFSKIKSKLKPSSSSKPARQASGLSDKGNPSAARVFWPTDILPTKLPRAKIWTYGYNSGVVGGLFQPNNQNSILQHGNDLMVKVARGLDHDDKPIIFVAHSLGGLLVKVALNRMCQSLDKREKQTFERTKAVVFCGTPHRGSNAAAWAKLASNLVSVSFTDSNAKLVSDLQVNAKVLGPIQEDFLKLLHQSGIRVHSFQEGRPSSGIKGFNDKVVDDFSSTCGWPLESVETIDADHRQMVKQPGADIICDVLRDINGVILEEAEAQEKQKKKKGKRRSNEPYTYLNRFFTVDYHAFLSNVSQRHPNTCAWLMDANPVSTWLSGTGPNILWLRGYPGLGKSVLARYLVEELHPKTETSPPRDTSMVAFFFCSYRDEKAKTDKSLVCSLIHQLVHSDSRLSEAISQKFIVIDRSVTGSMRNLWDILLDVIDAIEDKTLYIVIDALDELTPSLWGTFFTELLAMLTKTTTIVKVVITSRAEPEIEKTLGHNAVQLDLSKEKKNVSDVSVYLTDTVLSYGDENGFGDEMCQQILKELITRADGMFLWAKLAWSYFIDGVGLWTRPLLEQKLEELQGLPPGMDVLYHRILSSVDKRMRPELLQAFQWIVVATRPLTITEISIALGLRHRPRRAAGIKVQLNMRNFFKKLCPHLVKVDERDVITLVHQSFKDFLLQTTQVADIERPIPNEFFINRNATCYESGLDCLAYLGMSDFEDWEPLWDLTGLYPVLRDDVPRVFPFLDYSRHEWASHLRNLDDGDEAWRYFYGTVNRKQKMRWAPANPLIFWLFKQRMKGLLRRAAREGFDMNQVDSQGAHIVHIAVQYIKEMVFEDVDFLLSLGADINGRDAHGQTLLHRLAINEELDGIRQWMTKSHVDINAQNSKGETALHAAVRTEDPVVDILDILLASPQIDVNITDHEGLTPLCLAIHWCRHRATMRLLQHDTVDVSIGSPAGEDPLVSAIIQGWSDVALAILNKLDSVEPYRDNVGRNVLHWAAYMNMPGVFKAALGKQTTLLDAVNNRRWTPLHSVADDGNAELVELLLARGASTTAKTRYDETALHLAASKGHFPTVRLLLQSMPAIAINAKDLNGWTVLHRSLSSGRDDMTTWLLDQDVVNVGVRDKHGRKAIMFASAFASNDMLRTFLKRSPSDLFHVDRFGYDLVHMAAFYGNKPNVEYLLQESEHFDQSTENHWGKRALDLAPTEKFADILTEQGFTHSSRHLEQRAALREQEFRYETGTRPTGNSSSEWAVLPFLPNYPQMPEPPQLPAAPPPPQHPT
ncbi:ankyrin repeat-containing domain protein [Thelonectria olida]|uniref:Ankyrin repeat-containing domain protein n=1 Tax=Thelonectria olida TaxID=1576542 RepID=A0A9P9APL0_9HYPO|nr:ankyrin repeat-containing domain protein [Thelonectria olida]